jgi:glutathione synthase/RimK-type ligase-like ATP-grasp enzyme
MTTILQIRAIGNENEVGLIRTDDSGERRTIQIEGQVPLLDVLRPGFFHIHTLLDGGENFRLDTLPDPALVYNAIHEPDRCSEALERARNATNAHPGLPVINDPEAVLRTTPERLWGMMQEIQTVKIPKSIRIRPRSLAQFQAETEHLQLVPPYIVKEAGTRPGRSNRFLVASDEDVAALERFAFDGRDYFVTEFIDYRSADGYFRKYRYYVIGDRLIPGHLIISAQWLITGDEAAHQTLGTDTARLLEEEKSFLTQSPAGYLEALEQIRRRSGLDYFAIDFALDHSAMPMIFNIDCGRHYFSREKRERYYTDEQIRDFNHAVEMMIMKKLQQQGGSDA